MACRGNDARILLPVHPYSQCTYNFVRDLQNGRRGFKLKCIEPIRFPTRVIYSYTSCAYEVGENSVHCPFTAC